MTAGPRRRTIRRNTLVRDARDPEGWPAPLRTMIDNEEVLIADGLYDSATGEVSIY